MVNDRDLSFSYVLMPSIISAFMACDRSKVIDVGCGVGVLSERLATLSGVVTGIDSSSASIDIARNLHANVKNLTFVESSLNAYASKVGDHTFSIVVANMFLMNVSDLTTALKDIRKLINNGGCFIFSITHPCFWPTYREYATDEWFDYWKDIAIESPFRISLSSYGNLKTTHFHRPLQDYINSLYDAGLTVEKILEPRPTAHIEERYAVPWRYPRFLVGLCKAD